MDFILVILFSLIALLIQYLYLHEEVKPKKKMTKKLLRTYYIPIIGMWFVLKDYYNSLEDE